MTAYKQCKALYFLFLIMYPNFTFSIDLTLQTESVAFTIQPSLSDIQCNIFESLLSHLNNHQTNFFEDNHLQDKEEIEKIGVLRYQIACLVIEHLLKNSIEPKKIPHSIAAIKDILYRGFLFIPYRADIFTPFIKQNKSQLLKKILNYPPVTNIINKDGEIPGVINNILQENIKLVSKNLSNSRFNYPGCALKNPLRIVEITPQSKNIKKNQENKALLNDRVQNLSNHRIIAQRYSPTNTFRTVKPYMIAIALTLFVYTGFIVHLILFYTQGLIKQ